MRLLKLHLLAFGPFTGRVLDFGSGSRRLVVLYGPNEAGKSSALRAISDLRFGVPLQSRDNFVHAHPDMKIGGEFVDRHGNPYALLRRKGRGATLLSAEFGPGEAVVGAAAAPEVQALLTCGLTKDAYDAMFGLDHRRLREGGEALLKGEGDVGAALFEASAGVRSIPRVLEGLDAASRKIFMPGARGKNARVNEALKLYDDQHAEWRRAQVRPAQWADVSRKHQAAVDQLAELERLRYELNGKLLTIKELRAVAPQLATLDNARQTLDELAAVPLLSPDSAAQRAAAESGLAAAQHNARLAQAEAARQQSVLDGVAPDQPMLAAGAAVRRLVSSAEAVDQHRRDIADAGAGVDAACAQVAAIARCIDAALPPGAILAQAPSRTLKADIERLLRRAEQARQALDQHMEAGRPATETAGRTVMELPSGEARTALRVAQAEIARAEGDLQRLASLPAEIKAAQRAVSARLDALGLPDQAALREVRALMDAQIDAAMKEQNGNETRRDGVQARIAAISDALPSVAQRLERLLESGAVATRDEVDAARVHRDLGWALVRGTYIDGTRPAVGGYGAGKPLPLAYEEAVVQADLLGDRLAGDTERAALVQACKREIQALETDRDELRRQLALIDAGETSRREAWHALLTSARLPFLAPAALRDWQALLPSAHAARETLQSRLDELQAMQAIEQALTAGLRTAIAGTGLAAPNGAAALRTLIATADEVDATIRLRMAAINQASGQQAERERQRLQRATREEELRAALQLAQEDLRPAMAALLLGADAAIAVARTRMAEFDDLAEAQARLAAAEARRSHSAQALLQIADVAKAVQLSLGDAEPQDLRLYIDRLERRLDEAEALQQARNLARQARDKALEDRRGHEETAARHQDALAMLCAAAAVEAVHMLPEAEASSHRKRAAQDEIDRSQNQLALASRRPVEELRRLLAGLDAARMDADEAAWSAEQSVIDEKIRAARQGEEAARRELEAIDDSDAAAAARDAMERAAAAVRTSMPYWIRTRIAHALLTEAMKGFRERAQGPMLKAASAYFARMTRNGFVRLLNDEAGAEPVLVAQRGNGAQLRVEEMSEGTRDQLYLALRLAALDIRRASGVDLPVILDDILMTSDDERSGAMLEALADFAREHQVIVFTHHRHVADMAVRHVPPECLALVTLQG